MSDVILNFVKIHKTFESEGLNFTALKEISLEVRKGEFIGISGKSGSGKTTLLNIAGLIDAPTSGDLFVRNINTKSISDNELSLIRAQEIG
ncbi:MAG: ATP-binding cassette domain-containing protein, partial [Bacteriovorax sp.]|nr:ATP-binding cassette domain-containing protein [Bacteriovorax sp.]